MADNVAITAGAGTTVAADELVDGVLGTVKVQFVKLMDGTLDSSTKAAVGANGLAVNVGNAISAIKVGDGTNNAAIKAASTAPVATDPAMVVAISPNSVNANGQATMSGSAPTVPASNWPGSIALANFGAGYYVTVAAGQTAQVLQSVAGAIGDYLSGILVIPATTSPGAISLLDNVTSTTIFAGGASSVSNLVPFFIPLGAVSRSGAWKLTTGTNVSCVAVGKFS